MNPNPTGIHHQEPPRKIEPMSNWLVDDPQLVTLFAIALFVITVVVGIVAAAV